MTDVNDEIYRRTGAPGGPGAEVTALQIEGVRNDGKREPAHLLTPQGEASEVELLRTICTTLGVSWGQDEAGWWAAVPTRLTQE